MSSAREITTSKGDFGVGGGRSRTSEGGFSLSLSQKVGPEKDLLPIRSCASTQPLLELQN